jgi:peroxiredoxin
VKLRLLNWDGIAIVLLACSLGANILLAHRVSTLRNAIDELKDEHRLRVGDVISSIKATTVDGANVQLSPADTSMDTVIYVFSPTCHWCKENLPDLHALAQGAAERYRLVGISLSEVGLKQYITEEHLDFPIFANLQPQDRNKYHLGGTPETIVVAPNGRVKQVWMGAYQDPQRQMIEKAMGISLPHCCS